MPDHVDLVKEYLRQMEGWRKNAIAKDEQSQVQTYDTRMAFFKATVEELEHLRRVTKPVPASYGDLSDLPQDCTVPTRPLFLVLSVLLFRERLGPIDNLRLQHRGLPGHRLPCSTGMMVDFGAENLVAAS